MRAGVKDFEKRCVRNTAKDWSPNMSNVISREVIEELRRYKAGPASKPKLRREGVALKPNNDDEISRLVAALVMAIQEGPVARKQAGAA